MTTPRISALSLALSLLSGCVLFTEEPMGPCWGLRCGDCIASGCTWDSADRRCVVASAQDPSNGPNDRRTQRIDRCPAAQREVRVDASAPQDVRCSPRSCEPCADEDGCSWDLLDSVCRSRESVPQGRPVAISRAQCVPRDASAPSDAQPVTDGSLDASPPPDASADAREDVAIDAAPDDASVRDASADVVASEALRLRVVNALPFDRAIDLCVGPIGGPSARLIESVTPGGLRRAFRTAALVAGSSSSTLVATVVDAGSTPCATALPIGAAITIEPGSSGTQWFVVHSEGVTRFAADALVAASLRLRWLMVAPTAGSPTFEYDLAGRGTVSWSVRDRFGQNAETMLPSYVTALPVVPATNRLRATMVGGARTIESVRALPTVSGSYTAVLVPTTPLLAEPAQFLLLNEADVTPTRSAVW